MKNEKYLKFILTITAICLLWICIRDLEIGPQRLEAQETYDLSVKLVDVCFDAYLGCAPIPVMSMNPLEPEQKSVPKWQRIDFYLNYQQGC